MDTTVHYHGSVVITQSLTKLSSKDIHTVLNLAISKVLTRKGMTRGMTPSELNTENTFNNYIGRYLMSPYNSRDCALNFGENSIQVMTSNDLALLSSDTSGTFDMCLFEHIYSCISVCRAGFRRFPTIFAYVAQLAYNNLPKKHIFLPNSRPRANWTREDSRRIYIFECKDANFAQKMSQFSKEKFAQNYLENRKS